MIYYSGVVLLITSVIDITVSVCLVHGVRMVKSLSSFDQSASVQLLYYYFNSELDSTIFWFHCCISKSLIRLLIFFLQKNASLMKPWIVLACIWLILDAFQILGAFLTVNPGVGGIIGSIAGISIQLHYISVVCSYKKEVEEQSGLKIITKENV